VRSGACSDVRPISCRHARKGDFLLPAIRFVRWTVLSSVLVTVVVSMVLAGRSPSSPQSFSALFGDGITQTPWGPLGAADRDMLIKVRQANLWEGPTGELAEQQAVNPAVREVGRKLGIEHAQLDASLQDVAEKLNLVLPSQPSDQQRVWMTDIGRRSGPDFDLAFINVVRSAHGEVMPLVEGVRAGTQNQLVRQFGIEASTVISRHMGYLESTDLVDYSLFPPSTAPVARLTALGGYNVPITLVLFVIAVVVGAALLRELNRSRTGRTATQRDRWTGWWAKLLAFQSSRRSTELSAGSSAVLSAVLSREQAGNARPEPDVVTTAELIAVLNPSGGSKSLRPAPARPASAPAIPTQRTEPRTEVLATRSGVGAWPYQAHRRHPGYP